MAAPVGNQFWKLRSTHGREKLFATSELLWEACQEYFNWCDAHPWWKNEAIKGGDLAGKIIKISVARPYTLSGLCVYLDTSESFWKQFRKQKNLTDDFLSVIARVEEIITTQQFEGAAVGTFNANIIARKQGLADKAELTGEGGGPIKTQDVSDINYDDLSTEVLQAIMNARKNKDE